MFVSSEASNLRDGMCISTVLHIVPASSSVFLLIKFQQLTPRLLYTQGARRMKLCRLGPRFVTVFASVIQFLQSPFHKILMPFLCMPCKGHTWEIRQCQKLFTVINSQIRKKIYLINHEKKHFSLLKQVFRTCVRQQGFFRHTAV